MTLQSASGELCLWDQWDQWHASGAKRHKHTIHAMRNSFPFTAPNVKTCGPHHDVRVRMTGAQVFLMD